MNFELSEEQELLRDGVQALLDGLCDIRHVRAVAVDGDCNDPPLWEELGRAGWTGVTVPEAQGGAGLGIIDLAVVAIEAGRYLLYLPLLTTLLAARTIAAAPHKEQLTRVLSAVAQGRQSVTLALYGTTEDLSGEFSSIVAERTADGWRLSGELPLVPYGPRADQLLVDAVLPGGGRGLFVLPTNAEGVSWTALNAMDRTVRQYNLALSGAACAADASLYGEADAAEAISLVLDEWRTVLAAENLGACEQMLAKAVEYSKERVAFGRPIGANQAIKVRIAEMAYQVERMRSAIYFGAMKLDGREADAALAAAMAKAAASAPSVFVGSQAIHVHGGLGFTWENDTQLYFKRVKSNELFLGGTSSSLQRIAAAII